MADFVPGGDYAQYGTASSCPSDGRGTNSISNVYQITGFPNYAPDYSTLPYTSLGCWKDVIQFRALRSLEGDANLDGGFYTRLDAINKCYHVATFRGLTVFGLSDGGRCWGALDNVPGGDYARYGNASYCPRDGKGWDLITHVYQIKNAPMASTVFASTSLPYTSLGCFNDLDGSLPTIEGLTTILDGASHSRIDAINKCYQVAQQQGHNVFAVKGGGYCSSGLDNVPGGYYARAGINTFCPVDRKGYGSTINNVFQINDAPGPSFDFNALPYTSLGCWFDQSFGNGRNRLLYINEPWVTSTTFSSILDGNPRMRSNAINKCYQVATLQGHNVFALQDGQCLSSLDIVPGGYYTRAGNSSFCRPDGRGTTNINHVYQIKNATAPSFDFNALPYTSLGCWLDQSFSNGRNRALYPNEPWAAGTAFSSILDGTPRSRSDAINKCYQVATLQGHNVFALQEGHCYSALDIVPGGYYARYGNSSFCRNDGRGAVDISHVYQIKNAPGPSFDFNSLPYTSLGCWFDQDSLASNANRAIRRNEPVGPAFAAILDGNPRVRSDAINKCYQVAVLQGHNIFGLQEGSCFSQLDMVPGGFYAKFNSSSFCRNDGRGGFYINHVYQIKDAPGATTDYSSLPYTSLGCWSDQAYAGNVFNRALRNNEGTYTSILDGSASTRANPISKCYQVAQLRGHNVFAIQGGNCYSSLDVVPGGFYARYGESAFCPPDGRGSTWINHVYQVKNSTSLYFDWANLPYSFMGCFADGTPTALRFNEGLFATLDGSPSHVANRTDAINKCYQVASSQGHNVFALQNNGLCYSAFDIYPGGDYSRYGVFNFCPFDGRGGVGMNHVYRINNVPSKILTFADLPYLSNLPYSSLGCWADTNIGYYKALRPQEGLDALLDGTPTLRVDPINKCYQVAVKRGHNVFGIQAGACYSAVDKVPGGDYTRYGRSNLCSVEGRGAVNVNNVYRINSASSVNLDYTLTPYISLGCFQDNSIRRTFRPQEGTDSRLDGTFTTRTQAISKCHSVALTRGHNIFALQNNGYCYSGLDYIPNGNYSSYGPSTFCPLDGRGSWLINHVYQIKNAPFTPEGFTKSSNWTSLGCWNDNIPRSYLSTNEGNALLDGPAASRVDAIRKCYQVAKNRGHPIFVLANIGECWSSANTTSYSQYGPSDYCLNDGRGAPSYNALNAYQVLA